MPSRRRKPEEENGPERSGNGPFPRSKTDEGRSFSIPHIGEMSDAQYERLLQYAREAETYVAAWKIAKGWRPSRCSTSRSADPLVRSQDPTAGLITGGGKRHLEEHLFLLVFDALAINRGWYDETGTGVTIGDSVTIHPPPSMPSAEVEALIKKTENILRGHIEEGSFMDLLAAGGL
jgi:hypothetical protein